jgi:predicted unusual protein kinase regulating ubiquinone biosynthesis (AarF/ABC1/UbiB family)
MNRDATMSDIDIGRVVVEITRISGDNAVRQPAELTLLGKTLLNLDRVAVTLEPGFDVNATIRENAVSIMRRRMLRQLSPTAAFSAALEMNEFVQRLPTRLNRLLDHISENRIKLRVQAIDEAELISGIQKVANRITTGIVLAALILGAAMLMRVETSFRIFGYPGIAMLLFLVAVAGVIALVYDIFMHDRISARRHAGPRPDA